MPVPPSNVRSVAKDPRGFVGIDPGYNGGVVLLKDDQIQYWQMPQQESELDLILELVAEYPTFIEKVHAGGVYGKKSLFTFGYNYGLIRMGLMVRRVQHTIIGSKEWQNEFGLILRSDSSEVNKKAMIHEEAIRRFPSFELWKQPRTKGLQRAVCDALLIAEYNRRTNLGLLRKKK